MDPVSQLLLAMLFAPIQATPDGPAPRRIRLFDRMDQARIERPGFAPDAAADKTVLRELGFEPGFAQKYWVGHKAGREMKWESDPAVVATLTTAGGTTGGALRLGPGFVEDMSYLTFLVPAAPLCRYVLRGRVKLENHPAADEASAREVVRVLEHTGHLKDPTGLTFWSSSILDMHRVSRVRDASGWDRFEVAIPLSNARTDTLEIRLLQRSGGSADAATWFDDLVLEETKLGEAAAWRGIEAHYRPNDGREALTPWRLRVPLLTADRIKEETRDAVLLPPPGSLSIPVTLPPADAQPVLRFEYGMLPDAFAMPGDGARIEVSFVPEGGKATALATLEFDPKTDAEHQGWLTARVDLTPVAGRKGNLVFTTSDVGAGPADPFDAVILATPHIEPKAEVPKGWNVLVIASDTLRADRLSAFGYGRPTSPNLEKLAAHAVRFPKARSQAPWTLPSFSSIMTSMYPSEHGAGRGGHDEWTPLEPGATTLADVLARVGYETAGITANHLIAPEYGLDQGFESYAIPGDLQFERQGLESVALDAPIVVQWLEQHQRSPFFLFWHMMDPHLPYTTESAFRKQFTDAGYHGRFAGADPQVPFQVLDPRPGRRWFTQEGPPKPPPLSDEDKKYVSDYYDAEIREIDAAIGKVIDTLERTGLWDRTIVAMVADHGEGLGEHGHYHHGYTLFEDQVHIPFILRVPGRPEGKVVETPVASIDLAPSILGALGLAAPESFHGRDRLAQADAEPGAAPDAPTDPLTCTPIFLEYPSYDSSAQKGCVLGDFKYLHDPWFHTTALYDTQADPMERTDVAAQHPDIVARARGELDSFRWKWLQKGRFHVRVNGRAGAKLKIALTTDDLFDANFATMPMVDEKSFSLDFDRRHLVVETLMEGDRFEMVCWCRGEEVSCDVLVDGKPIEGGIRVGEEGEGRASPVVMARAAVPTVEGAGLRPPRSLQALFWMEPGAGNAKPVVPSPEEADMLKQLGYAH